MTLLEKLFSKAGGSVQSLPFCHHQRSPALVARSAAVTEPILIRK